MLLAEVPVERDALEQELLRAGEIVIGGQGVAEPPEGVRDTRRAPELPVERQTFFRPFPRDRNVSRDDRESGRSVEALPLAAVGRSSLPSRLSSRRRPSAT